MIWIHQKSRLINQNILSHLLQRLSHNPYVHILLFVFVDNLNMIHLWWSFVAPSTASSRQSIMTSIIFLLMRTNHDCFLIIALISIWILQCTHFRSQSKSNHLFALIEIENIHHTNSNFNSNETQHPYILWFNMIEHFFRTRNQSSIQTSQSVDTPIRATILCHSQWTNEWTLPYCRIIKWYLV